MVNDKALFDNMIVTKELGAGVPSARLAIREKWRNLLKRLRKIFHAQLMQMHLNDGNISRMLFMPCLHLARRPKSRQTGSKPIRRS